MSDQTERRVTEADFRMPQFRNAKPEDYEFRADGRLVRKDRWEKACRAIAALMGYESREGFELEHLTYSVEVLVEAAKKAGIEIPAFDELPD
jgi:cephalosporin-C deacetylase-like acetyl esterase